MTLSKNYLGIFDDNNLYFNLGAYSSPKGYASRRTANADKLIASCKSLIDLYTY